MRFGDKEIRFTSDTDEYVDSVWAPSVLINFVTCGFYSLCGCAEIVTRGFVDSHLTPVGRGDVASHSGDYTPTPNGSLPNMSSVPYQKSTEYAPLMSDQPPPYQYGAPHHQ